MPKVIGGNGEMGAQVKVLRRKAFGGSANAFKIEVDGTPVGKVNNGEFVVFEATPGSHQIRILDVFGIVLKRGTFTIANENDIIIEIQFNGSTGQLDILSGNVICECQKKDTKTAGKQLAISVVVFLISCSLIYFGAMRLFNRSQTTNTPANTQGPTASQQIQYVQVDLQAMLDELNANAMRAEATYQDMYIEVTGEIISFDSDGKYISIVPCGGSVYSEWVHCSIASEHQAFLIEKNVGDVVTIRGKVVSIGEVLGYSIDIIEIN